MKVIFIKNIQNLIFLMNCSLINNFSLYLFIIIMNSIFEINIPKYSYFYVKMNTFESKLKKFELKHKKLCFTSVRPF